MRGATAPVLEATEFVVRHIGIPLSDVSVLHVSQHISIRIRPARIVARVVSADVPRAAASLHTELEVVQHLIGQGSPIVGPTTDFPAGPHFHRGFALTLWKDVDHEKADENNPTHVMLAAKALRRVHEGLSSFGGPLPEFWGKPDQCRKLLEDQSALPALRAADRKFFLRIYARLRAVLDRLPLDYVPIHGDVHLGNVFISNDGALWHDFEDACLGPREWDLTGLAEADLACFEPVNREVLSVLRYLRSLCVSVWCWEKSELAEKRAAAEYHLQYLRAAFE